jgi:ABC-type multidrug transport system ATPase subunit
MIPAPLLVFDSIGKRFGRRVVLRVASLWGTAGRITVLLGRNGSGKSTLIRAGLGIVKPDHGSIRWEREILDRPRLHDLARRGLLFIPDRGLLSRRLRLAAQLELYAEAFGGNVQDAVQAEGLEGLLDSRVGELSGGEERRAEMAIARLRKPRCLLADEPFAGLAPLDRDRVAQDLLEQAASGVAVIVTGHEVEDLLGVADEVVWMVAGTTHVLGTAEAARVHDQFRREYLGADRGVT